MKRILVTGGSRGIGKAIVDLLNTSSQYEVIAPTRQECDLNSLTSVQSFLSCVGDVYALVNVAGVNELASLDEIDSEALARMHRVNVESPLFLIKGVADGMRRLGGGRIVNFSSIWGIRSRERRTMYSIDKFGIVGLTRALARELGPANILVNAVAPGFVLTEMTRKNVPPDEQKLICNEIPLRRMAQPKEIAKVVRFLISEENTYITGSVINIDGGFLA